MWRPEKRLRLSNMQEADNTAESCKRSQQNSIMGLERWEDLDTNILKEIFSQLPLQDVIMNTCMVCRSWRSASWDFLFWSRSVLDLGFSAASNNCLSVQSDLLRLYSDPDFPGKYSSAHQYDQMAGKLAKQLKQIMEGNDALGHSLEDWRRSIDSIYIPYDLELSDEHLLYIAERTPGVKHVSLLGTHKITAEGFGKAIQNWKFLKNIHLGPIKDENCRSQIFKEIGRNCKEVEELHIHQARFTMLTSKPLMFDIANNLQGLRVIGFEAFMRLTQRDVFLRMLIILNQLEEIHFHKCQLAQEFAPRCIRRCRFSGTMDGLESRWYIYFSS